MSVDTLDLQLRSTKLTLLDDDLGAVEEKLEAAGHGVSAFAISMARKAIEAHRVLVVILLGVIRQLRRELEQALGREQWWIENHADDVLIGERMSELPS